MDSLAYIGSSMENMNFSDEEFFIYFFFNMTQIISKLIAITSNGNW